MLVSLLRIPGPSDISGNEIVNILPRREVTTSVVLKSNRLSDISTEANFQKWILNF